MWTAATSPSGTIRSNKIGHAQTTAQATMPHMTWAIVTRIGGFKISDMVRFLWGTLDRR